LTGHLLDAPAIAPLFDIPTEGTTMKLIHASLLCSAIALASTTATAQMKDDMGKNMPQPSKDGMKKNDMSKDSVRKDATSKDSVAKDKKSVSKDRMNKDKMSGDSTSKDAVGKDAVGKDSPSKNDMKK
jgi:pentapeptide MXKDX repeat protein